jgi:CRP-like cAMP-binding protein
MEKFIPLADVDSVRAILSKISLFGGTTDKQLKSILCRLQVGLAKAGDYVFCEGDDPLYIYIVKRGRLELLLRDCDVQVDVHELGVGECFGEASIMSMRKHTACAIAMEDSEVMVLSRRALIELRHEDVELFALLMMNIARELARRLQLTDGLLLHYLRRNGETTPAKSGETKSVSKSVAPA